MCIDGKSDSMPEAQHCLTVTACLAELEYFALEAALSETHRRVWTQHHAGHVPLAGTNPKPEQQDRGHL